MSDVTTLLALLQPVLTWHRARLVCFAALVLAVLRLRTVCLSDLAQVLTARKAATNYRRLQRFFALFTLDQHDLAALLLALRPSQEPLTLVMDRTEWKLGQRRINLLVVGYLLDGFVVPLRWVELGKAGSSSEQERIALLAPLIERVGADQIKALVADREFIGRTFFGWMIEQQLRFVIRIRKNAKMTHRNTTTRAEHTFADLARGTRRRLRDRRQIYGHSVYVAGAREGDEPWIVVTNRRPSEALRLYGQRWAIETTFAAFKSRGFDLEATHLRASDRLEKLIGVLSVALVWVLKLGQWRQRVHPIRPKRHGRRAVSVFRLGTACR